jgi:hypothetical protein
MGFFQDLAQYAGTGISDADNAKLVQRDVVAMQLAKKESDIVMGQVGFYAAIGGLILVTLIIAWKKM